MRRYTNFEEVNRDLRILKLQSEINTEELKLHFRKTKDSLSPGNLITGLIGGVATSAVILRILTPIACFAIGKFLERRK